MSRYVLDASVAIKWFVPEIYSNAARQLLASAHNFLVPDFFFAEVGNVLWKRVRRDDDSPDNARQTLADLNTVPIEVYLSQPLMPFALNIAIQTDAAVYDSLYLALAITQGCQMVTADQKFYNALKNSTFASSLLWVEDI
ncbi:MAG: PIN domain-containing protein [Brasilonema octagenarum HA4186-MV1]|jgi:predicted nucleic acid-binding protein|uniref:PIN domain nuclease n=1 Tax=Brasilonema sennae CENA114 TaxID=415709 RepID=A0A856MJI5_9CYAN|nr:type II toxin-antitoxin system VapC family toxin [Brasilonema sennae]MBW4625000.1 PIN domain-containing protein [Brasilonema octagenarum HA4186-MV1]QDL10344.1 PIN domain nuclease [Brasilonema sennae CENA114]QDL16691.1 PIN domain nuclease [Brasilonema octagenarum UFV-E1]